MDTTAVYHTKSADGTEALGRAFGHSLKKLPDNPYCLLLHGQLGSGKTTFVRGLLSGLGYTGRVLSPTFTFQRRYDCGVVVHHFDLYRGVDNAMRQTVSEIMSESGILAVEWPEKLDIEWPKPYTEIYFESVQYEHILTVKTYEK